MAGARAAASVVDASRLRASLIFIFRRLRRPLLCCVHHQGAQHHHQQSKAYGLPKLASAIEASFCVSLDSIAALKILQEAQGLHALKAACEEKVAEEFETCSQNPDFGKLGSGQLARILEREDLIVSREEAVLKGVFNWLKISKDREAFLGAFLPLVDFKSMSVDNLLRLGHLPVPGLNGDHLHRKVKDALQAPCRKRTQSPQSFRPKRRCLQHWSPDLGASTTAPGQKVLPRSYFIKLCWHEGAIYALDYDNEIFCWKPGEPATHVQELLGDSTRVAGINDPGMDYDFNDLSISPTGEIFVFDSENERLVGLHNGVGRVLLTELPGSANICCSPNGVLHVLTGKALMKLEGSRLQTVATFPGDLQFSATAMVATKQEVIYILDRGNSRILRIDPTESLEPVVVGQVPAEHEPDLWDFCVTEGRTIYVAENRHRKVLAIRPGDTTFTEVLECPGALRPRAILVQGRSLYISMGPGNQGLYKFALSPELQLE